MLPNQPQGQLLAATIRINLHGHFTLFFARDILIPPVSRGSLNDSMTSFLNSGNSSRNKIPWWARETSPGLISEPKTALELALWCGERTALLRVVTPSRRRRFGRFELCWIALPCIFSSCGRATSRLDAAERTFGTFGRARRRSRRERE